QHYGVARRCGGPSPRVAGRRPQRSPRVRALDASARGAARQAARPGAADRRGRHPLGRRRAREGRGGCQPRAGVHRLHLPGTGPHRPGAARVAAVIVGVPREVKAGEQRVALLPETVRAIVEEGHDVHVETRAGLTVGFDDEAYRDAGAMVVAPRDAWDAELIVKVKEMQDEDLALAQRGSAVFSFHHLLGAPVRTRAMAARGLTAIAFEMVRDAAGRFPMLAPMSR